MIETVQPTTSSAFESERELDDWLLARFGPDPLADAWPFDEWEPQSGEPQESQASGESREWGQWRGFDQAAAALQILGAREAGEWRDRLSSATLPASEAGLIDLLRALEDVKSAACAVQARAAVTFDATRRQAEADRGVPLSRRGIGVSSEVALARRESPHRGGRLVGLAKALVRELPQTLQALADGILNEWRVTLIARETACLDPAGRARIDAWLAAHLAANPTIGDARLVGEVRRKVIEIDQDAVVRRRAAAAGGRRVSLRPLPDGMVQLTAILELREGVGVYAALTNHADQERCAPGQPSQASADSAGRPPEGQTTAAGHRSDQPGPFGPVPPPASRRGRGARMADALVQRVTGRPASDPCGLDLTVVITAEALLAENDEPAHVNGYGPMPASWVRQLITATADRAQQVAVRRLFRGPGRLVRLEAASRFMSPALRHLIAIRDQTCRTPWCGAPIRQSDHVRSHAAGGASSLLNGQGLCEACNYTKQQPGWHSRPRQDPDRGHVVSVTTPTGHTYESTQPSGPGDR